MAVSAHLTIISSILLAGKQTNKQTNKSANKQTTNQPTNTPTHEKIQKRYQTSTTKLPSSRPTKRSKPPLFAMSAVCRQHTRALREADPPALPGRFWRSDKPPVRRMDLASRLPGCRDGEVMEKCHENWKKLGRRNPPCKTRGFMGFLRWFMGFNSKIWDLGSPYGYIENGTKNWFLMIFSTSS